MLKKQVFYIIGLILLFLSAALSMSSLWSLYYDFYLNQDSDLMSFIYSIFITFFSSIILIIVTRNRDKSEITNKDGFAIVTLGWILIVIFSSLPYYFYGNGFTFTNAFFESMSGLTTTGASILGHSSTPSIESLPHGLLFWRSFTSFLGGMGIIVFSIAILPLLGMGGVQLFRAEVAGPVADKMTPRVKQTAKLLWTIYLGLVLILTILLLIQGLSFHDSICHAFTTIATAGFSTKNASIGAFSPTVQWTIIIFMFIAGTSFTLHYIFISNKKMEYLKDTEFKVFSGMIIICSFIFLINVVNSDLYKLNFESVRHSIFNAVTIITTTGFTTENYSEWPALSKTLVFFLFFVGGCAGSTTGAMKIIRSILIYKYLVSEIRKMLHPNGVFPLRINGNVVPDDIVKKTLGFYLFYIFIFVFTALIFAMLGLDVETALSASASSIGNIGPALGSVGPAHNWAHLPELAKWLASFCMLLGRLEIFTVMVLFSRTFWKK